MNKILLGIVYLNLITMKNVSSVAGQLAIENQFWNYDYCDIVCNKTKHTMCVFPPGGGDTCNNNLLVYLTRAEKVYIEDNMNRIRLLVATGESGLPKASNMMKLVWDRELSTIAKRWADQCREPQHDWCRWTRDEVDTGQSVYIGRYKDVAKGEEARMTRIKRILETWDSEKAFFDPNLIQDYNRSAEQETSNYTQMIWATTEYVGCGYTEFEMIDHVMSRFVCNFKRRGNIPRAKIYREGKPCSVCPARTVCSETYKGMCWNKKFGSYVDLDLNGASALRSLVLPVLVIVAVSILYGTSC